MTTHISKEWDLPLEDVMDRPARKKLTYMVMDSSLQEHKQSLTEQYHDADHDMSGQMQEIQQMATHTGGETPGLDATVPDDTVTPPTDDPTAGSDRLSKREEAKTFEDMGRTDLFDMRDIHPAVRKHGNVVRVRNDEDADDFDPTIDYSKYDFSSDAAQRADQDTDPDPDSARD